jgi:hypothetical protein
MKGFHMGKLMQYSTNPTEVTEIVTKMVAWANDKNEPMPGGRLRIYLGCVLFGICPNSYCLARDLKQVASGAKLFMTGTSEMYENMPLEEGFPRLVALYVAASMPYQLDTHCCLAEQWVSSAARRQGTGGVKLLEIQEMWTVPNHARLLVQSNVDYVHSYGRCVILLSIRNSHLNA